MPLFTPISERLSGGEHILILSPDSIDPHVSAWEQLVNQALEPNVFFEPWMLRPALQYLQPESPVVLMLIYDGDPAARSSSLLGLFPLTRTRVFGLSTQSIWLHKHCFLGTPLIHRLHRDKALNAFLTVTARLPGCQVISLPQITADGPVHTALLQTVNNQSRFLFAHGHYERALLKQREQGDSNLENSLSGHRRRRLRRHANRLNARYSTLQAEEPIDEWLTEFLSIEARGWKGREGTALACNPSEETYFRTVASHAHQHGCLLMSRLKSGDKTIAIDSTFLSDRYGFAFKIAHDEEYSSFSPGILLETHTIREFEDHKPNLAWIDSCNSPAPSPLLQLWRDRRPIVSLLIAGDRLPGRLALAWLPHIRKWSQWLRHRFRKPKAEDPKQETED